MTENTEVHDCENGATTVEYHETAESYTLVCGDARYHLSHTSPVAELREAADAIENHEPETLADELREIAPLWLKVDDGSAHRYAPVNDDLEIEDGSNEWMRARSPEMQYPSGKRRRLEWGFVESESMTPAEVAEEVDA